MASQHDISKFPSPDAVKREFAVAPIRSTAQLVAIGSALVAALYYVASYLFANLNTWGPTLAGLTTSVLTILGIRTALRHDRSPRLAVIVPTTAFALVMINAALSLWFAVVLFVSWAIGRTASTGPTTADLVATGGWLMTSLMAFGIIGIFTGMTVVFVARALEAPQRVIDAASRALDLDSTKQQGIDDESDDESHD